MSDDSIYSKLAKSGWLGTKAQVADKYGSPAWKNDGDAVAEALKRTQKKVKGSATSLEEEDSGG